MFLIDPSLFAEIDESFNFWQLLIGTVSFVPKEGFPRLLAEQDGIQLLMVGFVGYLEPEWTPRINSHTFWRLWLVAGLQFYNLA